MEPFNSGEFLNQFPQSFIGLTIDESMLGSKKRSKKEISVLHSGSSKRTFPIGERNWTENIQSPEEQHDRRRKQEKIVVLY